MTNTSSKTGAFQDYYPEDYAQCYGCGRLNEHGYQIKTTWDVDETLTVFTPQPYHTAVPGYVYGGLIASLIDCHSTGSAAGAAYRAENREMDSRPPLRFVTASLHVDYLKPTPLGVPLEIRGTILELKTTGSSQAGSRSRWKVVVSSTLTANGVVCAKGEVTAVQIPDDFL